MRRIFADTFYFLALINRNDSYHARVKAYGRPLEPLFTTGAVLLEVGDALADAGNRGAAGRFLQRLRTDSEVSVVAVDHALYERGLALYCSRPDKNWSLTDCISFCVMDEHGILDALTADHHFAEAGFVPLFAD